MKAAQAAVRQQKTSPSSPFIDEVIEGLSRSQKTLPCKYFYDEYGSQLFEQICELEEYYPTRTELSLLQSIVEEVSILIGKHATLLEPGSGAGEKIQLLLKSLDSPKKYVPIEISEEILERSVSELGAIFSSLEIAPIAGDFVETFSNIPRLHSYESGKRVIFFPGSTIGNFEPESALSLLEDMAKTVGTGGGLLIGVDMRKDINILEPAYNDSAGVTAAFNKNILTHINREAGSSFDLDLFDHHAFYNKTLHRIEMHLVSLVKQKIEIGDTVIEFNKGETIHTENSHKHSIQSFKMLAEQAGFTSKQWWTDPQSLFSIHYMEAK